jgi:hypothetical protein
LTIAVARRRIRTLAMRRPSRDARSAGRLRRLGSRTARPSSGSVLLALGVAFAAFQVVGLDLDRAPSWDEAIYLSQVEPGAVAQPLAPWRARGITFLVAPALWLGAPLTAVRAILAVLAAAALVAAFRTWLPTLGSAAALAAALFASSWIALLYGSEVMPNLWVAFAGTGAAGLASRAGRAGGRDRDVTLAGVLIVAAALVRPFDVALLVPIVTALLLLAGTRRTAAWIPVAAWAAGTLVWLVETAVRSGGVLPALARASGADVGGKRDVRGRVVAYLGAVDGPAAPGIDDPGLAWGAIVASLLVASFAVGLVRARGRPEHRPLLVTTVGGAAFAGTYVAFVGTVAPRFLAPALALLSLGVAYGVREVWRGCVADPSRRTDAGGTAVRVAIAAAVAAWTLWQTSVASSVVSELSAARELPARVGAAIGAHDRRRTPCAVVAEVWAPQIGYAAGCRGRATNGSIATLIARERRRGAATIFLVVRRPVATTAPTLETVPLPDGVGAPLRIYRVLAGPVPR